MLRNNRLSFLIATLILCIAALLRLWEFTTLPLGLHQEEIIDIRLTDNVRQTGIQVFYDLGDGGREGIYPTTLATAIGFFGRGQVGYHMLSLFLSLITLALVYALTKRLYGHTAALGAMGLLAFSFFPNLLSRQVGRETLLPALVIGVLLALALALPVYWRNRSPQTQTTAFAALGLLLGMSFYLHPAGLMMPLLALLFVIYMLFRGRLNRSALSYISFTALMTLIIATPYLIASIRNPELGGAIRLLEGLSPNAPNLLERFFLGIGAIGLQGDRNPIYNLPGRPLFDPISALLIGGGLIVALRYFRKPRYAILIIATSIALPLAVFSPDSPSFIAFASALPVLAMLFGLGAASLIKWSRVSRPIAFLFLGLLFVGNIGWTTRDLIFTWRSLPTVQTAYSSPIAQLADWTDRTSPDIPTVVCVAPVEPGVALPELTHGQLFALMSHRQNAPLRTVNCESGWVFVNGGAPHQAILTEPSVLATASPFVLHWLSQGEPMRGNGQILSLDLAAPLADLVGRFTTTTPVSYAPESGLAEEVSAPPIQFGGNLTFLGYQLPQVDYYPPGGFVTVTTYWRVDGELPRDLQLFTHVLSDPAARPAAQVDTISVVPSQLQRRDVFMQVVNVPLPATIPDGTYIISVGAYQNIDKQRLSVLSDGASDRLFLYTIQIATR